MSDSGAELSMCLGAEYASLGGSTLEVSTQLPMVQAITTPLFIPLISPLDRE